MDLPIPDDFRTFESRRPKAGVVYRASGFGAQEKILNHTNAFGQVIVVIMDERTK